MAGALPHLWQRLRRRWVLRMLRARQAQLAECISGLAVQISIEQVDLHSMQIELADVCAQLAQAEKPLPVFPRTGWGQP